MEMQKELIIGGRRVYITGRSYRTGPEEKTYRVPVIFWPVSEEHGRSISESAEYAAAGISASTRETDVYLLAAFEIEDWNRELSPWKAEIPEIEQSFGGGADETLRWIINEMIPRMKLTAGGSTELSYYVAGYSLAGLFALWASSQTDTFTAVAAASPSVWIEGWIPYADAHPVMASAVYLSLGKEEEHVKNRAIKKVGNCLRKEFELLGNQLGNECCTLVWEEGNHFTDNEGRLARAFAGILLYLREK